MHTILCIDDRPTVLQFLALLLQFAGHKALIADSIGEGVRLFTENPVDLLILDYGLPGTNAATIAERLRKIRPVRVLMFTGDAANAWDEFAIDGLIVKPCEPQQLLDTVEDLLNGQERRDVS